MVTDLSQREGIRAKRAFFFSQMVQEPFIALYPLMAVLLSKELGATPFQIAVLTMLKPAVSVLSFYWGSFLSRYRSLLKTNLLLATTLAVLPFLFAPFSTYVWFFVAAGACYSLFSRAAIPALMELLKINTVKEEQERLFSKCLSWAYAIGFVVALLFGIFLDMHPSMWRHFLGLAAMFSLLAPVALSYIPDHASDLPLPKTVTIAEGIAHPWKDTFELLRRRPDFLHFQIGFFLAGFGLMVAMPAIPSVLSGLDLSYTQLFLSMTVLKGIGFIITSSFWAKFLARCKIQAVSCVVFFGFCLFFLTLLLSCFNPLWVLLAYLIYGVVQAGSHLVWHLSGSIFAGPEMSAPYSSVNILAVGIRGIIAPPLGGFLAEMFSPQVVLVCGGGCCIIASMYIIYKSALSFKQTAAQYVA
jgi:MFS family permease